MSDMSSRQAQDKRIILITRPAVQANTFAQYLRQALSVEVIIKNINSPDGELLASSSAILFDITLSNKKLNSYWQDIIKQQCNNPHLFLINSAHKYELSEIAQWTSLYGIFRYDDNEGQMLNAIRAVISGDQSVSLSAMHPSLYARVPEQDTEAKASLTERECEILYELRQGATNQDIARVLFISENTVRTHLYNVFRKISVKNRTQAVSWANRNLHQHAILDHYME
ncbi:LuxR C-terminal-related transcriptional regulator [Shimwellia blattae]|uniref:Transcriptional regulatory protein n=1 Tax=Shimwellia blattae (strain ATCC 29907 / DSM 4481 / JCM 1650 / NBRC 105725 / CDC 9005-74) TaxID=630626 RepID=I2B5V1_SHIBC|nr:LuxR C-terminal-related transcriptional regulator [Shimwellia blattae]AFJ45905.1 transcriptional regulatory protein [Shimwellia blattae DSM 4481 = NBRC 105725]GAB81665.1 putative LuxR family transcriptional regulator [Shimwellia blattae DSM 4481 = NBRC 105725]VDY63383.1 CsgBAC operon transcriptional regulatory protein [Shimwellia blattae]VEC21224.1 CsgBAC operon transcriptional regulatory protein [Shimwellia blattae]